MVKQEQLAETAKQSIQNYLNQCQLEHNSEAADALMNLIAAAGVLMVAVVGHGEGVARMCASVDLAIKKTDGVKFAQHTVN